MKPFLRWCLTTTVLTPAGCSSTSQHKSEVLVVPLQSTLQQEVILARMKQILASQALTDNERAQLLCERGILYDSLDPRALTRNNSPQALAIRPDMPEVFSCLGIYLTQADNSDIAYRAFDPVLELDPTYNYARLNHEIALYYGGRDKLTQDDLLAFYQGDPNDPSRSPWPYLAEQKFDEKQAKEVLKQHFKKLDKEQWGWNIVKFYLGSISERALMGRFKANVANNVSPAKHLSKTNFYLDKYYLSLGDLGSVTALFRLAVANNAYNLVEHRYTLLRLSLLGQDQDGLAEPGQQ